MSEKQSCDGNVAQDIIRRSALDYLNEKTRAWRRKNREKVNEWARAWYAANRERISARRKERYDNEPGYAERVRAASIAYGKANRGKLNAYQKAWRDANRERLSVMRKERRHADREYAERMNAYQRAYRARRKLAGQQAGQAEQAGQDSNGFESWGGVNA